MDGKEALARKFFPGTGASYDRVVRWTTLGRDAAWKRRVLELLPPSPRRVLELACGTGILTRRLVERFPDARILGVDLTEDYLVVARARLAAHADRVEFRRGDATQTSVADAGPFDAVVTCYLPKYVDLAALFERLAPALAPGAVVVLHDFDRPRGVVSRLVWRAWFGVLHLVAPRLHPEWRHVFDHSLLELLERTQWPQDALAALRAQGVGDLDLHRERLTASTASIVWARWPATGVPGAVSGRERGSGGGGGAGGEERS